MAESGYPDSHLARPHGAARKRNLILATIPVAVLIGWFVYLWGTSGVLAHVEEYPGREGRIRAEGYLKRVGLGEYRKHGRWVTYHEDGQKASEGFYEEGEKTGEWRYWDESGAEATQPEPDGP